MPYRPNRLLVNRKTNEDKLTGWMSILTPTPTNTVTPSITPTPSPVPRSLFAWGHNNYGQLGLGDTTDRSSPVQVGALTDWLGVAGGYYHTNAYKNGGGPKGTLWGWGRNSGGFLIGVSTTDKSSPIQIGTAADWHVLSRGTNYSGGGVINSNNAFYVWGYNTNGELGTNDGSLYKDVLTNVGTAYSCSYGATHGLHVSSNNTMYVAGANNFGQLGLNDTTTRSPWAVMFGATNWRDVQGGFYASYGIRTDGTLWSWGRNNVGQLGLNDTTNRSSPVQIGSGTWKMVSSKANSVMAIKSDGTLWGWGSNSGGILGDNTVVDKSSPVQIGTGTNWSSVSCGLHTLALQSDGTLWSWGQNSLGQLGNGNTTSRSSPVQVGSLTSWVYAEVGYPYTSFGIKTS